MMIYSKPIFAFVALGATLVSGFTSSEETTATEAAIEETPIEDTCLYSCVDGCVDNGTTFDDTTCEDWTGDFACTAEAITEHDFTEGYTEYNYTEAEMMQLWKECPKTCGECSGNDFPSVEETEETVEQEQVQEPEQEQMPFSKHEGFCAGARDKISKNPDFFETATACWEACEVYQFAEPVHKFSSTDGQCECRNECMGCEEEEGACWEEDSAESGSVTLAMPEWNPPSACAQDY